MRSLDEGRPELPPMPEAAAPASGPHIAVDEESNWPMLIFRGFPPLLLALLGPLAASAAPGAGDAGDVGVTLLLPPPLPLRSPPGAAYVCGEPTDAAVADGDGCRW